MSRAISPVLWYRVMRPMHRLVCVSGSFFHGCRHAQRAKHCIAEKARDDDQSDVHVYSIGQHAVLAKDADALLPDLLSLSA